MFLVYNFQKVPCCDYCIVLVNHGESEWDPNNLFTGWYDAELTEKGIETAHKIGQTLKEKHYYFDLVYTSQLTRATKTKEIILEEIGQPKLLTIKTWKLNERHFGDITGLTKEKVLENYDASKLFSWTDKYDSAPPSIEPQHEFHDAIVKDKRYEDEFNPEVLPATESFADLVKRVTQVWKTILVPKLKARRKILVVAHETSLRALVKLIEGLDENGVLNMRIPAGIPFEYILDEEMKARPWGTMNFIGRDDEIEEAKKNVQYTPKEPFQKVPCCDYNIILVNHGETKWDLNDLFTGWYDADLSESGIETAHKIGQTLKRNNYYFDLAYTSQLTRATKTMDIILEEIGQPNLLVIKTWKLNERHYGDLTGFSKEKLSKTYDPFRMFSWTDKYYSPPPSIKPKNPYHNAIANDERYQDEFHPEVMPTTESFVQVVERVTQVWKKMLIPKLKARRKVLVVAHETSLRALVKLMADLDETGVLSMRIPAGIPFEYILDEEMKARPWGMMNFIGREDEIEAAKQSVEYILDPPQLVIL